VVGWVGDLGTFITFEGIHQANHPNAHSQEPFGILPLEAICDSLQRNIEVRTDDRTGSA